MMTQEAHSWPNDALLSIQFTTQPSTAINRTMKQMKMIMKIRMMLMIWWWHRKPIHDQMMLYSRSCLLKNYLFYGYKQEHKTNANDVDDDDVDNMMTTQDTHLFPNEGTPWKIQKGNSCNDDDNE